MAALKKWRQTGPRVHYPDSLAYLENYKTLKDPVSIKWKKVSVLEWIL